jgi:hypothetical protein
MRGIETRQPGRQPTPPGRHDQPHGARSNPRSTGYTATVGDEARDHAIDHGPPAGPAQARSIAKSARVVRRPGVGGPCLAAPSRWRGCERCCRQPEHATRHAEAAGIGTSHIDPLRREAGNTSTRARARTWDARRASRPDVPRPRHRHRSHEPGPDSGPGGRRRSRSGRQTRFARARAAAAARRCAHAGPERLAPRAGAGRRAGPHGRPPGLAATAPTPSAAETAARGQVRSGPGRSRMPWRREPVASCWRIVSDGAALSARAWNG